MGPRAQALIHLLPSPDVTKCPRAPVLSHIGSGHLVFSLQVLHRLTPDSGRCASRLAVQGRGPQVTDICTDPAGPSEGSPSCSPRREDTALDVALVLPWLG